MTCDTVWGGGRESPHSCFSTFVFSLLSPPVATRSRSLFRTARAEDKVSTPARKQISTQLRCSPNTPRGSFKVGVFQQSQQGHRASGGRVLARKLARRGGPLDEAKDGLNFSTEETKESPKIIYQVWFQGGQSFFFQGSPYTAHWQQTEVVYVCKLWGSHRFGFLVTAPFCGRHLDCAGCSVTVPTPGKRPLDVHRTLVSRRILLRDRKRF